MGTPTQTPNLGMRCHHLLVTGLSMGRLWRKDPGNHEAEPRPRHWPGRFSISSRISEMIEFPRGNQVRNRKSQYWLSLKNLWASALSNKVPGPKAGFAEHLLCSTQCTENQFPSQAEWHNPSATEGRLWHLLSPRGSGRGTETGWSL